MSIVERPRYEKRKPDYAVDITEVVAEVILGYDDSTEKESTLLDVTYEPTWKQPPDVVVRYTAPKHEVALENSWTRKAGHAQNTGISIDAAGINHLMSRTSYASPRSIAAVRINSPWPYPTYGEIKSFEDDLSTEVGDVLPFYVPARGSTPDIDVVAKIEDDLLNDAAYLSVEHYWFKAGEPLNVMYQNSSDDGVIIPFPGLDPRNSVPYFGSISIDSYNFVDRYGMIAMLAGGVADIAAPFATQAGVLGQSGGVKGLAQKYGVDALQVAGILGMGMYFEWIDEDSLVEHLLPAMGAGFADKAAGWAIGQLPEKYTEAASLLGGRISAGDVASAGVGAASLLLYLQMLDDIALHVEM
jgi:hypothetical protein